MWEHSCCRFRTSGSCNIEKHVDSGDIGRILRLPCVPRSFRLTSSVFLVRHGVLPLFFACPFPFLSFPGYNYSFGSLLLHQDVQKFIPAKYSFLPSSKVTSSHSSLWILKCLPIFSSRLFCEAKELPPFGGVPAQRHESFYLHQLLFLMLSGQSSFFSLRSSSFFFLF